MLVIPSFVHADVEIPGSLEKPTSFSVRYDNDMLLLRMTQPDSIINLIEQDQWIMFELDWKINDGPWRFDTNWDMPTTTGVQGYYEEEYDIFDVCGFLNNINHDEENSIDVPISFAAMELDKFDLENDTYSFRYRYLYEYDYEDPNTNEWAYKYVVSPYSDITSIGKLGTSKIPNSLDVPLNLAGELKEYPNGQPYFHFTCTIPNSVIAANQLTNIWNLLDWKIGDGKWASEIGNEPLQKADKMLSNELDINPVEKGGWDEIEIEENTYYFRMFFEFEKSDETIGRSQYSNVVKIGTLSFYKNAAAWAIPELDKAQQYGFISDKIKNDMSGPITREEFAEIAVIFYEKTSGKKAVPTPSETFTDTSNPEVLKAFNLGITTGLGNSLFGPNQLLTREQMAAMITRSISAAYPATDLTVSGVADFADQLNISSWAVGSTKFM